MKRKKKAEHGDVMASIRRGLAQAKKGQGRPVDEVFDDLERECRGEMEQV